MYNDFSNEINELREIIMNSQNIVFFGGAGVSTESDIPDFRSSKGLFSTSFGKYSAEEMLHTNFFFYHPKEFYQFYKSNMVYPYAEPNNAHYALAELENKGKLRAVITQNIDGLHQKAGSENVIELHGSVHRNYCTRCGKRFGLESILECTDIPLCDKCGGMIRPDVTLYGETLNNEAFALAEESVYESEVFIVGGTSLNVYPAAGLVNNFMGRHLIIINKSSTPYDNDAEIVINDPIGEVFSSIMNGL